jgi:hypothetical protein
LQDKKLGAHCMFYTLPKIGFAPRFATENWLCTAPFHPNLVQKNLVGPLMKVKKLAPLCVHLIFGFIAIGRKCFWLYQMIFLF